MYKQADIILGNVTTAAHLINGIRHRYAINLIRKPQIEVERQDACTFETRPFRDEGVHTDSW